MVGYTALMQENEHLARAKRMRLKEVLETSVSDHFGKILQYYGDGSLSIFNSAIDAVNSAIEIQKKLKAEPKVDLRIGLHTGDIIIEEGSVYGDGVNIASRVESLAVPGSIFISERVYDDLKNQHDIFVRELGYFELKNVKQPLRIFVISNAGLIVPSRAELQGKIKRPANRLAVLPFVNMSADPENEYFSDGVTEELLNALTKVDGLQVTSRTSAFAFKGKHDDIRDIGLKLNVDKILEGSVRKSGNRVRISAQLINASDGYHIWSENYDRDLNDIFQVQDEISSIIANRLKENLSLKKKEQLIKPSTKNVTAYTFYLKGLHYWNKLTPADAHRAIECYDKAIQLEPGFAQAYAMTAGAYAYLGSTGQLNPDKAFEIVHKFSDKALELDNSIAESHIAKASAYLFYDWKWQAAFEELQKALELNPAATDTYYLLSMYYIIVGKKTEAIRILLDALEIDPLSTRVNVHLIDAYIMNSQYDDALNIIDKLLEIDPTMRSALENKGWCEGLKGDWKKAAEIFEEVHRLTNHPLRGITPLGVAYAKLGETEKALEIVGRIEKRQAAEPDSAMDANLLLLWWGIGDRDKVYYYFKKSIEKRIGPVHFFLQYPLMNGISDDPRIAEIIEKDLSVYR